VVSPLPSIHPGREPLGGGGGNEGNTRVVSGGGLVVWRKVVDAGAGRGRRDARRQSRGAVHAGGHQGRYSNIGQSEKGEKHLEEGECPLRPHTRALLRATFHTLSFQGTALVQSDITKTIRKDTYGPPGTRVRRFVI
jgi:hypothetical protein